jgi:hypothetical protein
MSAYCKNHTKPISILCGRDARLFIIKEVVHIVTTGLQRLFNFKLGASIVLPTDSDSNDQAIRSFKYHAKCGRPRTQWQCTPYPAGKTQGGAWSRIGSRHENVELRHHTTLPVPLLTQSVSSSTYSLQEASVGGLVGWLVGWWSFAVEGLWTLWNTIYECVLV